MKTVFSFVLVLAASILMSFNTANETFSASLKPFIELRFDQVGGTNGCAVAYNPQKKLYYAAIAGNSQYPLEVFNEKGMIVYKTSTKVDLRGLWFNEKKNRLEGNLPGEKGIFSMALNSYGFPTGEPKILKDYIEMPDFQSVGTFSGKKLYFFNGNGVEEHKGKGSFKLKKTIDFTGSLTNSGNYNNTTIAYTGIKNEEFAVLDYVNKKINIFNLKGKFIRQLSLPYAYPSSQRFCFSYANESIFLYDATNRVWTGFR